MLNLKNKENDAVFDENCKKKKAKIKIKFQKNERYPFGQHPLVEKLPTATDIYIYKYTYISSALWAGGPGGQRLGPKSLSPP